MCLNEDASAHSSSSLILIQVCSLSGLLKRDPARIGLQAEKHPRQVRRTHAGRKKKGKKINNKKTKKPTFTPVGTLHFPVHLACMTCGRETPQEYCENMRTEQQLLTAEI